MAKKVILKDLDNIEMMPVTRGELIVDSLGNPAFSSNLFLATQSLPGLMSGEDKTKLDSLEKVTVEDKKVEQVNTTTNNSYRILFSNSADDTTKTEGTRKSAKLLFNPSTGALTATALIGKLDWSNLNEVPEAFTPAQHIHNTSEITALTSYSKASSASDLVTTDTLNVALGKLEYKADTAYTWYKSITDTDTDDIINKWSEVVDFVNNLEDDVLDTFVTTNTKQTITGEKTFSGTSALLLNIDRNSTNPAWIRFLKNGTLLGYLGVSNDNKAQFNNGSNTYDILHSGNSHIKSGVITINGATITPITSHQSLANYVTLNGKQDITGEKTFKATVKAYDINPVTNNTYSLGTSSLAWKNIYATNGNFSSTVNASGFVKKDSSDDKVLLGGGGHKALSDFAMASAYVKKAGDTMTGRLTMTGEGIIVTTATTSNYRTGVEFYKGTAADTTYSYDAQIGWHNTGGDGTGSICILPYATSTLPWGGNVGLFITKTDLKYNGASVWHAGNDGSGSGLDADLLDGKHASAFALASHGVHWEGFTKRANSNASWGTLISSNGYTPLFWLDSTNTGGVAFSDKSGQTFMQIDGYFYQNEGKYLVLDTNNYSSYTDGRYVNVTGDTMTGTLIFSGISTGNWTEGIRINDSTNGWTSLTMGGTATSGTGAKIWSLHTYDGNFYISKNGSSAGDLTLQNVGNHWYINTTTGGDTLNVGGWIATVGNTGWYSTTHKGGWYMIDGSYVRTYNNVRVHTGSLLRDAFNSAGGYYSSWNNSVGNNWTSILNPANAVFSKDNLYVNHGTALPMMTWANTVNSYGYVTRYSIGSVRPTNDAWGILRLCVGNNDGGTSCGCYMDLDGDGAISTNASIYAAHFYENSDVRLKTNIENINNSDNIPLLKSFDWKDSNIRSYGLIAQELEEQGYSELVSEGDEGKKTVNYSAALSLIVGKLQVKIKELEEEIEILKKKN